MGRLSTTKCTYLPTYLLHGPRLPPQPGQGALYSPDWVVIPCLKDKKRK